MSECAWISYCGDCDALAVKWSAMDGSLPDIVSDGRICSCSENLWTNFVSDG